MKLGASARSHMSSVFYSIRASTTLGPELIQIPIYVKCFLGVKNETRQIQTAH